MAEKKAPSPLETHLGYWLRYVSNQVSHAFATKVQARGVTVAEWVVMRELYDAPKRPSDLAQRLGMTRGAISKLADRLAAKELLTRKGADGDRRVQVLALTGSGQRLVPQLAALADANDDEFFGHIDAQRRALIEVTMRDIVQRRGLRTVPVAWRQLTEGGHALDKHAKDIARAMTEASDGERIDFPAVVRALGDAGFERYHADLLAGTKTYYMPDGSFETVPCHRTGPVAHDFAAAAVSEAIGAIQRGEIRYCEFCRRIAAAGCVGYFVTLAGACAVYYGRRMETHVERFPQT